MKWHIETKNINDLKEYEQNPRQFTEKGIEHLKESINKFGLAEPVVVNTDNTIIGGHARVKVMKIQGITEVECYIPERELTPEEVKELVVRLNKNIAGDWDYDILANTFETEELVRWGFEFDDFNIDIKDKSEEEKESKAIKCPECGHEFKQ